MKVAIAFNNILKNIEFVKALADDFSYEHHLALRLSIFSTHSLFLFELLNDIVIDVEKSYYIIYDKNYQAGGLHKAMILEREPVLSDIINYMSSLANNRDNIRKMFNQMLEILRQDMIMNVMKSVGVEVIRTVPRNAVKHLLSTLEGHEGTREGHEGTRGDNNT